MARGSAQLYIRTDEIVAAASVARGALDQLAALALAQTPDDDNTRRRMTESLEWMIDRMLAAC